MDNKTGILLVNLGTPKSPEPSDVFKYLIQFLTDSRVIDLSWLKRNWLVRAIIVPSRYKASAASYKAIWTDKGSPLLVHSKQMQQKLQDSLGSTFHVALGMRYQEPSLEAALAELQEAHVAKIIVVPLFPQYASATTGSVHQKVMEIVKDWNVIPEFHLVSHYADHPEFIKAWLEVVKPYLKQEFDQILISFHGLPEKHIYKADRQQHCLKQGCCNELSSRNYYCYRAQCMATARKLVTGLGLKDEQYTVAFQSRLGKGEWLKPYAVETIKELANKGYKKLLVISPSFVTDCLETLYEIKEELQLDFRQHGGEQLTLIESLNAHPVWIDALKQIILAKLY
ncbi:MAG: hemH [Chlamydiales bacterium]|jgi:ferrochelatase|nr:hemH [Chlamydiales bacterium]